MKIDHIIQAMLKRISSNKNAVIITPEIKENIRRIKEICNAKYQDQQFYGAASLNRLILLDSQIATLLTPETILAILSLHATTYKIKSHSDIAVYRNSSGYSSLAAILYYGFNDGIDVVQHMPNNQSQFGVSQYKEQKRKFDTHTQKIIKNIKDAAKMVGVDLTDEQYQTKEALQGTLLERFDKITKAIDRLKKAKKSKQLLDVPTYSATDIRQQAVSGFCTVCKSLNINYSKHSSGTIEIIDTITLQELAAKFVKSNEAVLNGTVIHLFYDRAHLEACIEQDTKIKIGNNEYRLRDVLREMIAACETQGQAECGIAKEQFHVRLKLVENHLQNNFQFQKMQLAQPEADFEVPDGYVEIKKILDSLDRQIESGIWACRNDEDDFLERDFFKKILDLFDSAKGKLTLKNCLMKAKGQCPLGYEIAKRRKETELILYSMSDELPDNITQGPRRKSHATKELEKLIHALLGDYKTLFCAYNSVNELEIEVDGVIYNVTKILKHQPDYSQIELSEVQISKYSVLIQKFADEQLNFNLPYIKTETQNIFFKVWEFFKSIFTRRNVPTDKEYKKMDTDNECSYLSYGEKLAISIYSSEAYTMMQSFLRHDGYGPTVEDVPNILLSVCVAAHGLSKPTDEISEGTSSSRLGFRKEISKPIFLKDRIQAANTKTSVVEKGFVSSSETPKFNWGDSNITTVFHNNGGISGAGKRIATISCERAEKEVLHAPGVQYQYTDYVKYNGQHFFSVRPIRSIDGIAPDSYTPIARAHHELELARIMLEKHVRENKHNMVHRLFDTVSNKSKLACCISARKSIGELVFNIASGKISLDTASLESCKQVLEQSILANTELVRNSTLPSSLGKTDKVLKQALKRVDTAIELISASSKLAIN